MPTHTRSDELRNRAYAIACKEFSRAHGLTPDEKRIGPDRLRWYIQVLIEARHTDPSKIADLAQGMMRQYEQIVRSKARVESEQPAQRKHNLQISIPSIRITSTQKDNASEKMAEQDGQKSSSATKESYEDRAASHEEAERRA